MAQNFVKYAVTIKPTLNKEKIDVSKETLNDTLLSVINTYKGVYFDSAIEVDSKELLHLHAIFLAPRGIVYVKSRQRGWHIFIRKMYSNNWKGYMLKNQIDWTVPHFVAEC